MSLSRHTNAIAAICKCCCKCLGSLCVNVPTAPKCCCHHIKFLSLYGKVRMMHLPQTIIMQVGNCFKFQSIKNSNKVNSVSEHFPTSELWFHKTYPQLYVLSIFGGWGQLCMFIMVKALFY